MSTWPNRGASGGPCGELNREKDQIQKPSGQAGLTQANWPPRNSVRFNFPLPHLPIEHPAQPQSGVRDSDFEDESARLRLCLLTEA